MTVSSSPPHLPPRRLRVLVVRHGETHENVSGIIQGQLDTPLNPFGHLQALTTARHLSTTRIHRIITFPLQRARDTAQAILSQQPDSARLKLEQDERLKERSFGVLEGKVYSGPKAKSESTDGIEQVPHLVERLAGFWNSLVTVSVPPEFQEITSPDQRQHLEEEEEQVVVLVSHGASISGLLREVLISGQYLQFPEGIELSRFGNCSITEILVPTIPDRRIPSPSLKPPGDLSLKNDWTIRPPQAGVQCCQILREIDNLRSRLDYEHIHSSNQKSASPSCHDLQTRIDLLQKHLEDSERRLKKEGKHKSLLEDVLRGPDGQEILQDLGYGKGLAYIKKWADGMRGGMRGGTDRRARSDFQGQRG